MSASPRSTPVGDAGEASEAWDTLLPSSDAEAPADGVAALLHETLRPDGELPGETPSSPGRQTLPPPMPPDEYVELMMQLAPPSAPAADELESYRPALETLLDEDTPAFEEASANTHIRETIDPSPGPALAPPGLSLKERIGRLHADLLSSTPPVPSDSDRPNAIRVEVPRTLPLPGEDTFDDLNDLLLDSVLTGLPTGEAEPRPGSGGAKAGTEGGEGRSSGGLASRANDGPFGGLKAPVSVPRPALRTPEFPIPRAPEFPIPRARQKRGDSVRPGELGAEGPGSGRGPPSSQPSETCEPRSSRFGAGPESAARPPSVRPGEPPQTARPPSVRPDEPVKRGDSVRPAALVLDGTQVPRARPRKTSTGNSLSSVSPLRPAEPGVPRPHVAPTAPAPPPASSRAPSTAPPPPSSKAPSTAPPARRPNEMPDSGPGPVTTKADLLFAARRMFEEGHLKDALGLLRDLVAGDPGNVPAKLYADSCEKALIEQIVSRLGGRAQVPRLALPPDQISRLALDHRAGFLLACIDGASTLDDVLDLVPMSPIDAFTILDDLAQRGVVTFQAPSPRSLRRGSLG